MFEFDVINKNTPIVRAKKKNDSIALVSPNMPRIYHKDFDLTEFIGEEIANIRGVNTVRYFPILFCDLDNFLKIKRHSDKRYVLRTGSFDFEEKGIIYVLGVSIFSRDKSFNDVLNLCCSEKNREEFLDELLEVYGLDIFTGQSDRPHNLYYEIYPNGELHVGKLFDYEYSLNDDYGEHYVSDFHIFKRLDDYQSFMIKYPKLKEILKFYFEVDLMDIIDRMALIRKFDLSCVDLDNYKRFNDYTHKKLEKILR